MSETEKRIAAIQAARARNNGHWMDYLRLAHRVAPDEAMEIAARINAVDEEILKLNGKLAGQIDYTRLVAIQARMASTRLPGKVLMDIGGESMIWRVWEACRGPWQRVVLTSVEKSDDILCEFMDERGMNYMRGSHLNVLSRYMDCLRAFRPASMIRICGDAPFMRKEWIAEAFESRCAVHEGRLLHGGPAEIWKCAGKLHGDQEHAGSISFEGFAESLVLASPEYFSVNTPEDLERARAVWASRASS